MLACPQGFRLSRCIGVVGWELASGKALKEVSTHRFRKRRDGRGWLSGIIFRVGSLSGTGAVPLLFGLDDDATAVANLNAEVMAFKDQHTGKRNRSHCVNLYVSGPTVPDYRGVVYVKVSTTPLARVA